MYIRTELNDFKTEKQEQEPEGITRINKYHKNEQNLRTKKCFRHISIDTYDRPLTFLIKVESNHYSNDQFSGIEKKLDIMLEI